VNSPYGRATDVKRLITTLDTVIGDEEFITQDAYNVDGVPVCLVTSDIVLDAYSLKGDNPYQILFGKAGVEVVTTLETLALQDVPASAPSQVTAASRSAKTLQLQANLAAIEGHQLATFARERALRTRKLVANIRGGVR
jgi:hypothetical protein